jgi:hypothetical protein
MGHSKDSLLMQPGIILHLFRNMGDPTKIGGIYKAFEPPNTSLCSDHAALELVQVALQSMLPL